MCYTAGPRCSPHALTKLVEAKETFNQVDPTDLEKMNEAKHDLFVAQEEYLTSPAGIKKLRDKAKSTGDNKYALQADEYAAKRKEQIAVSKAIVAAQDKVATKKPSQDSTLEEDLASEDYERKLNAQLDEDHAKQKAFEASVRTYLEKKQKVEEEIEKLEKFRVPENLARTHLNYEYDQDGTQCGYDGQCHAYPGDYCRDSEYINLRLEDNNINTRRTLADIYNCDESDIPDDLEKIGREELDLDNPDSYEVEAEYGYYGVEGAHVSLYSPIKAQTRLEEYYKSEQKKLKAKEAELEKTAPKVLLKGSQEPLDAKPVTPRKTASKAPAARKGTSSKRGSSKATVTPAKAPRRERTPAELDAFERDEMTPPPTRKATVPRAAKPASKAPKRRERTPAELDAFELDERS